MPFDVIIGLKWLKKFNPDVDWSTGKMRPRRIPSPLTIATAVASSKMTGTPSPLWFDKSKDDIRPKKGLSTKRRRVEKSRKKIKSS